MRYAATVALAFALLPAMTNRSRADEESALRLRVLSYNIHHGAGVDDKLDLERIARVIKSVKPDVVSLQEVDQRTERTNKVDQAAELARLTSIHVAFGGNIRYQGGDYGNAILSKRPIKRTQNHRLPNVDHGEQRGVLEAEIEITPGQAIMILATHLDFRRPDAERIQSAEAINALVKGNPERAWLLVGDLNDTPTSKTLETLAHVWTRTNPQELPTSPVETPNRQIDYVLVAPKSRWIVIETRVLDERVASDHRPLLAVVELVPLPTAK